MVTSDFDRLVVVFLTVSVVGNAVTGGGGAVSCCFEERVVAVVVAAVGTGLSCRLWPFLGCDAVIVVVVMGSGGG